MRTFIVTGPSRIRVIDGKQKIVKYPGDDPFELPPKAAQTLLEAGDIEEVFEKPKPAPRAKATSKVGKRAAKKAEKKNWPLKSTPESYLKRYPDGPQAGLAKEILGIK